jgi:hypothetical protein
MPSLATLLIWIKARSSKPYEKGLTRSNFPGAGAAMLYTVEVRRIGVDLAASMAEMRTWLDYHRVNPTVFEHSLGGPGIAFRVRFRQEGDALAFAKAFGGWFNNGIDANGAGLWHIGEPPS